MNPLKKTPIFLESLSKEIGVSIYLQKASKSSLNLFSFFKKGKEPAGIIVPGGDGELLKRVLENLSKKKWSIPLIIAENEKFSPFGTALLADLKEEQKKLTGQYFDIFEKMSLYPQIVEEKRVLKAIKRFKKEYSILLDAVSGAEMALLYQNLPLLKIFPSILVII